jgi:hypothetical protein
MLTEEQQERIRQNKARALEIQKRRKVEQESAKSETKTAATEEGDGDVTGKISGNKRRKMSPEGSTGEAKDQSAEEKTVEPEEFEMGASEFVTKKEAMKMYCLPEGTLAVCAFSEKPNPQNSRWTPMKLFNRSEIRRRARERFGGIVGLIAERQMREDKRFQKDLERTKDVFR